MAKRWTATIRFNGDEHVTYHFDEYDEFGHMMENGLSWNIIDEININYNYRGNTDA